MTERNARPREDRTDDDNLGDDGTIPNTEDGVAVGHTTESSFEPEEDEQAT